MSALIRLAVPEDAAALTRLNREEMGYDYPEEDTKRQLEKLLADESNRIYVAESDGTVKPAESRRPLFPRPIAPPLPAKACRSRSAESRRIRQSP